MSKTEILAIKTAALLHDIGKLAIPEHILAKPGPLNPEEFQKVRVHPEVGAGIISAVPFPYPVASLILSHHERWDGRGYPAGLKEDEIPLGARVICIADYFEALTSHRPYHAAIDAEATVVLLKQESGKALDPRVVDAFVDALPQMMAAIEPIQPTSPKLVPQMQTGRGVQNPGHQPVRGCEGLGVRRYRGRPPGDVRALPDSANDGHEARLVGHDVAYLVEALKPCTLFGLRVVPVLGVNRATALSVCDGHRL